MKRNVTKKSGYIFAGIIILLTFASVFFLPVHITLLNVGADSGMIPFGGITGRQPLELCLSEQINVASYENVNLELLLATYNRTNTSHYTLSVFETVNGQKKALHKISFEAEGVTDNAYKPFAIHLEENKTVRPCLSLTSTDATSENALTVWLNADSEPVLRITAKENLLGLINHVTGQNTFPLGKEAVLGLFLTYIASQIFLIIYILTRRYEPK
jgi:hypothetical protein